MQPRAYETLFRVEDEHWWYRQLRRVLHLHLDRYLPAWRDAAILDAGFGTGGNLAHLPGAGRRVGLEVSTDALKHARQRDLARLVRGTVTSLPFAPASFDAAISTSVIYHQWVRDPAVARCASSTACCGRAACSSSTCRPTRRSPRPTTSR